MDRFNCRSPFIIEVDGDAGQVGTKIFLEVYSQDGSTLLMVREIQKKMFSPTQRINYYNISPFVYDVLNTLDNNYFGCVVYVHKFYTTNGTEYIDFEDLTFVSTNGYSDYLKPNNLQTANFIPLSKAVNYSINYTRNLSYPTLDCIFNFIGNDTVYFAEKKNGSYVETTTIANTGSYYFQRFDLTSSNSNFNDTNTFKIYRMDLGERVYVYSATLVNLCEIKYTPIKLDFVNRFGGLQSMTLFKNSTQNIEAKGSEYNTNTFSTYPIYDTLLGQKRVYNKNGSKVIKCNSGWVNEEENLNIQDILLSENLLLTYTEEGQTIKKAVTLKSSSQLLKTGLNEKVINYELEFEVASQLINNVV